MRTFAVWFSGCLPLADTISPAAPPQICNTNSLARSIASRWICVSTPRSKRNELSEPKPYWRDLPAMMSGANHADSSTMFCVSSDTALASPPIKPAMLNAAALSATTKVLSDNSTVLPLRHASVSPFCARRTVRQPESLSASKTCIGCPISNIT